MKKRTFANVFLWLVLLSVASFPSRVNPSAALPDVPGYRMKGSPSPAVVITEFSDFQCPSCAKAQSILSEIVGRHPEVVLIFRNYPLKMHKWAFLAATAAECAGAQGKFWEYQSVLFDRQSEWDKSENAQELFVDYAASLGMDTAKFKDDLAKGRGEGAILKDMEEARAKNVNVTPTFFINERRLVGDGQLREYGEKYVEMEKTR